MSALLTVQRLCYSREKSGIDLFHDLSFKVNLGEQVVIYGSSGSGKTTLAGMLCELIRCRNGQIVKNAELSLVTQEFNLYKDLTVVENLEFIRSINDVFTSDLEFILNQFNLADCSKTRAAQLPMGKRKMLQLACAVSHPFDLLILDEPTMGLDSLQNRQIWGLLENLNQTGKASLVLTATEAELAYGDRGYRLEAGNLITVAQQRQFVQPRINPTREVNVIEPA